MEIHSFLFGSKTSYERMATVLKFGIEKYSPRTKVIIHKKPINAELRAIGRQRSATYVQNATKTLYHRDLVNESDNGSLIGLFDCDLMVLRPLYSIENQDFDLAITHRPRGAQFRYNTGVVFVRVSNRTKKFYDLWYGVVKEMLADRKFYEKWKTQHGGINQCALAYLLANGMAKGLNVHTLECQEWNCENESWRRFDRNTRIVHLLGDLREAAVKGTHAKVPYVQELAKRWNALETEATK